MHLPAVFITGLTLLVITTFANPFVPLEHRGEYGSCATTPCQPGYCCSKYKYCGKGPDYCGSAHDPNPDHDHGHDGNVGTCIGGVGGHCYGDLCCSPYGYCGTGEAYCGKPKPPPAPPAPTICLECPHPPPTSTSTPFTDPPKPEFPPPKPGWVNQWGQCGGKDYAGATVCKPPYKCTYYSAWWSDCR
ncbi:hypothetical protein BJ878DRAFT_478076 [Calycina marina]|uniref:CBM1 domain-containing protein n=1 Tax=Calycina marina TaxID=1763456 RepID=A0A9P8CIN1_9HELO|nr:hypothetical protein BJ878DRAFT_478076 [Calycina marina]